MCDDKSPVLPVCDLHQKCDGRPRKSKGDHSLVSQKGSNYFLRSNPNTFNMYNLFADCEVVVNMAIQYQLFFSDYK